MNKKPAQPQQEQLPLTGGMQPSQPQEVKVDEQIGLEKDEWVREEKTENGDRSGNQDTLGNP